MRDFVHQIKDLTTDPPQSLMLPTMKPKSRILMGGGTTNVHSSVLEAYTLPLVGVLEEDTLKMLEDVKDGLRYVFQTKNDWTLALNGMGHMGMEVLLSNLVESGDRVVVLIYGIWGHQVAEQAERLGATVLRLEKSLGETFSLSELNDALRYFRPSLLFAIHGESSAGVRQNLDGVGELCRTYECLLAVDVVATIGTEPVLLDKWKIDAAFCNSQKGLGSLPGLAPITFGPRAVEKIQARITKTTSLVHDMKNLVTCWGIGSAGSSKRRSYHQTLPLNQIRALREALRHIAEETLEKRWERHAKASIQLSRGLSNLGLKHSIAEPNSRLVSINTFHLPEELHSIDEILKYSLDTYQLELGSGLGPKLQERVLRISVIGINTSNKIVESVIRSVREAIAFAKLDRSDSM